MATKQNKSWLRSRAPAVENAGTVKFKMFEYKFDAKNGGYSTADVVELGELPAHAQLVKAVLVSANIAAVATIDIGFMTGAVGDNISVRTVAATAELFNDATKNATATLDEVAAAAIAASADNRSIGLKLSANEAAGTGYVRLFLYYTGD